MVCYLHYFFFKKKSPNFAGRVLVGGGGDGVGILVERQHVELRGPEGEVTPHQNKQQRAHLVFVAQRGRADNELHEVALARDRRQRPRLWMQVRVGGDCRAPLQRTGYSSP